MKTGLVAVAMLLSTTWIVGGLASERQLGSAVDDAISATIRGGGCMGFGTGDCATTGTCVAVPIIYFSGDGDWEQATTVNCGGVSNCISYTSTKSKCGT